MGHRREVKQMTNEERQQAIEWLKRRPITMPGAKKMFALAVEALEAYVPDMNDGNMEPVDVSKTEQADGWMERNKDRILQAGLEGREVEFRIGGRLFAIREKAQ
jgi:hypothetical protein